MYHTFINVHSTWVATLSQRNIAPPAYCPNPGTGCITVVSYLNWIDEGAHKFLDWRTQWFAPCIRVCWWYDTCRCFDDHFTECLFRITILYSFIAYMRWVSCG